LRVELVLGAAQAAAEPGPAAASLAGASLLVADPQPRTRSTTVELTRGWGLSVRTAASGRQALALLREAADRGAPFDMALLDRSLEDPPVDEVARAVRQDPRLRATALVLLVASGIRGDAAAAQAAGFSAYLPKPLQAGTLLACLQTLRAAGAEPGRRGLITVHSLSERQTPSLNLLLADDNPVNCRLTSIILQRAGHRVDTVGDGEQALSALQAKPYDLVLMDVQMPVMNGLEAARRIRALADARLAGVPIVAITANAMKGDDEICFAAGMDGYVTKPISAASLIEAVERYARQRGH
jgi:CheY-like chemotaxis protein